MQTLILGCGFVGSAFGVSMGSLGPVFGTCRSVEAGAILKKLGIEPVIFSGDQSDHLNQIASQSQVVLASIPPTPLGDNAFVALEPILQNHSPQWTGYLSTTGVYGQRHGGWAFEDDVLTPLSTEAQRRTQAEANWRSLKMPAHIFRLPGIYGPGRSALNQVLDAKARRIDSPGQIFSRAHQDDIVAALRLSIAKPNPGRAYNICDDYPCASGDVIEYACQLLNRPTPPLTSLANAKLSEMGQRFYSECKRVSNARVKAELGWRPLFPSFREGLADCYMRLANKEE
jgi:nucleoside-diphosphate-sugar epimerase